MEETGLNIKSPTEGPSYSTERAKIPFDKAMPLQFRLIGRMLPEAFAQLMEQAVKRIEQGEDGGGFGDVVYARYAEKYSQSFDDYCHSFPAIVKKVNENEVTDEDYEHIILFFKKDSEFFTEDEIKDLKNSYLH